MYKKVDIRINFEKYERDTETLNTKRHKMQKK